MRLFSAPWLLAAFAPAFVAQEVQEEVPPGPATYADIDSVLVEEILLPIGATWRYFPGVAEPSEGLEWTQRGFDDSEWLAGASPLGWGHADNATQLDGIEPPVTTLYLRAFVSLAEPELFETIHLELPTDDGFICWLDGVEADRLHAGHAEAATAFDKTSTWPRTLELGPLPIADLTETLQAGDHCIAIQGLVHTTSADTLSVRPLLRARYKPNPRRAQARYEELARRLKAEGADARLAYLAGRHLQLQGTPVDAVPFFARCAELDPEARLPWVRLAESRRAAGTLDKLAGALDERVRSGKTTAALLDVWARVRLEDLGSSPVDLLELVPAEADLPERGFFADAYFAGSLLALGEPLRIDAGALEDHGANGQTWSRDRFATQGFAQAWDGKETPYEAVRACERAPYDLTPVYRVPLADGTYELALHLATETPHQFDVFLEGARVRAEFDPTTREQTDPLRFPVRITDGFLELDVFPRTGVDPRIAGLVITRIEPARFQELARTWAEETAWSLAFPIVQLAEAYLLEDDLRLAFDFFEQAALLPDFRPRDRARMALAEDELLPELLSYRMADDLVVRRGAAAAELLPAILERASTGARRSRAEAAWDDLAMARARYLEGRLHQVEGRLDDAIIAFEELAFSGRNEAEPLQRFAECLIESHLLPEAAGVLEEGLFGGAPATPELLRLWISLNLGELERGAWEVVAQLSELEVPEELIVLPTSETVGQAYEYLGKDPPSTTWSRPNFDASSWPRGPGGLGTGLPDGSVVRSPWETNVIFARRPFTLPGSKLLYPHARAAADDAGDVYLNGTMVSRISARTDGYVDLPLRKGAFEDGLNYLGLYAINYRGGGFADVGLLEPLGDLIWVLTELEERDAIRINCGGEDYEDADGTPWSRDRFFGYALYSAAEEGAQVEDASDQVVYQTQSSFGTSEIYTAWYQIPLPNGVYSVTLHFAELADRDPVESPRPFTVQLEKAEVLKDYDVIVSVGESHRAEAHTFEVSVSDGWLDVDFKYKQHAFLNGIESRPLVVRCKIEPDPARLTRHD